MIFGELGISLYVSAFFCYLQNQNEKDFANLREGQAKRT